MMPQNFTTRSQEALQRATQLAQEHTHQALNPLHLLLALLEPADGVVVSVFKKIGLNTTALSEQVQRELHRLPKLTTPQGGVGQILLDQEMAQTLNQAAREAEKLKDEYMKNLKKKIREYDKT